MRRICSWAKKKKLLDAIEILGFVDDGVSVNWITEVGGKVINLLCKGSEKHCRLQLGKSPEEHFADIRRNIDIATKAGLKVNLYLEDWSNGITMSPQ